MEQEHPFNVFDAACPSRSAFSHVTGRWGGLVMAALSTEPIRFGALRRAIGSISEKMLSQTLHDLEADGFVVRDAIESSPPHVEYRLSPEGLPLAEKVRELEATLYSVMPTLIARRYPELAQPGDAANS